MAKKKIPTVSEVREYLAKEEAYLKDCTDNNKTYVITGPKFPGENIWKSKITLPLLEAAEEVGASNEEIWELCKKIAQTTHAPVTLKDYQRMQPFAEKEKTVDTVLKLLESYIPPFDDEYWFGFDIAGYYYCLALISLSDYRREDCEKQLWTTVDQFFDHDTKLEKISVLLRNMKVLGKLRPVLRNMQASIESKVSM
ncbi:hypothetical protein SAMN02910451_01440 [Butyrivibrio hungatei]|uniref:Uncharacterized protein n=1 Tax=Butyrivibrio hungatei TaxID=185008 RepID=A0A1G5DCE0_9FIRM|nr:hypothetical protein [Butyrivibrio hungatei]SCY12128.1 hypothetical protein SAMN02910451_01440 [Butyrivibrio hungatei]